MREINIIIFILCILFFIIFLYILFTNNNKLIKIIVTKERIESEDEKKYTNILKNKLLKKEICDGNHSKKIKYDLCKECKRQNKCYDPNEGICSSCTNNYSCEKLYGCN
jgi:hypothetical protein